MVVKRISDIRFKSPDECCHPDCESHALADIASQIPLCERHIFVAYRMTNKILDGHRADRQEYQLLPSEADFIPGPCVACGVSGLLVCLANGFVVCKSGDCRYEQDRVTFGNQRKMLMGMSARDHSVVYYMRLGNRTKIGTTTNLKRRISSIQPEDCMVYEFGGYPLESRRHRQFAHLRVSGEWFDLQDDLIRHVNTLSVA